MIYRICSIIIFFFSQAFSQDYLKDCAGVWGGDAVMTDFYYDLDGDGQGAGSAINLCSGLVPEDMVDNNFDEDDDCYSNVHDCVGVCDGDAVVDDCGVCDGGNADQDCAGECGGSAVVDECDTCDSDPNNDCTQDCAGEWGGDAVMTDFYYDLDGDGQGAGSAINLCSAFVPEGMVDNNFDEDDNCASNVHDCAGTCDGDAVVDDCGVCDGGNADQDCAGVCGGSAVVDECDTCDSDPSNDCTQDCTGVWGGDANLDNCNICDSDATNDCTQDCGGEWGGSAYVDNCSVCVGGTTGLEACVQDCAGGWGDSAYVDNCGACVGGTTGEEACVQDCAGVWGGDAIITDFYFDLDGDGLGAGIAITLCSGYAPPNLVTNNDDEDDDCYSNVHDCSGTCDGDAVIDDCDVCDGGNANQDCNGICFGYDVLDNCEVCDSNPNNDCVQDCTGAWGGSASVDECGICEGDNSSCADCADVPNGDSYEDECNVCDNDPSNDCTQDCAGVWGGASVNDECGICDGNNGSCSDECGVPNGDNSSCSDECGVPNGDNTTCADCAGVPNGDNLEDNCGNCDADRSNDCIQDYLWPIKAKKEITAVFGEERPGRYHTGIDIRTFGEIGYHLVAIDDGYISRIRTSSKGYGKTIYLTLHDGNTAVYAHLDHFTPEVDNLVNALHEVYGKYTIDHKIDPDDYPVKRGDLLGYSGDTGGVSGPHLHFEIRDGYGQPVNPFLYSLDLPDNLPPEAESIAVIPLDENAVINGFSEQKIFPLQKINDNEYVLADPIFAFGNIGIAIKTIDKISGQHFNFGIYSINLLLDAQFIYSMQYNKIDWGDASKIYTERSYSLAREGYGKYYHIFSHHENQSLPFINIKSRQGFNFDQKIVHDAIIDISDFAGNKIEIRAFFVSNTLPSFDYSTNFHENNCTITFKTDEKVRPQFYLTEPISTNKLIPTEYYEMGNNTYLVENIIPPFNVLQISGKNSSGISSPPTFHMKPQQDFENINGEFKIKHYEQGLFISFKENIFSGMDAFLSLKKEDKLYSHKLKRDSKLTLTSGILSPSNLENVTELKVYYESSTPYEIFSMEFSGDIIYPDSSFQFELLDGQMLLTGKAHTFYDTTFVWSRPVNTSQPKEGQIITGPYFLKPYLIPFNNEIQLKMAIEPIYTTSNIGIYYYNQKKNEWNYLPSQLAPDSMYISTSILSGEIFAVIEENNPPKLSDFIPDLNGTYYSSDLEHISFNVIDSFSGIEGETDIIVKLDDNPVVFEYNSYQNKVRYPLKYNLKKGVHTLYVQASDKVGNRSIIKGEFFIK